MGNVILDRPAVIRASFATHFLVFERRGFKAPKCPATILILDHSAVVVLSLASCGGQFVLRPASIPLSAAVGAAFFRALPTLSSVPRVYTHEHPHTRAHTRLERISSPIDAEELAHSNRDPRAHRHLSFRLQLKTHTIDFVLPSNPVHSGFAPLLYGGRSKIASR